jgi:hypothetical protein
VLPARFLIVQIGHVRLFIAATSPTFNHREHRPQSAGRPERAKPIVK